MSGGTGELAYVIDMIRHVFERRRAANIPWPLSALGIQHPNVQSGADEAATLHDTPDVGVAQLTLTVDERSAVVMTSEQDAAKLFEHLVHRFVRQMCDVEDHAQTSHRLQ